MRLRLLPILTLLACRLSLAQGFWFPGSNVITDVQLNGVNQPATILNFLSGSASGGVFSIPAGAGGVSSVAASSPLSSSGGITPSISLSGIVGAANGGTGLGSAGGVANRALYTADGTSFVMGLLPLAAMSQSTFQVTVGAGLSGGGSASLGGSVSVSNSGVLSVLAAGPLSSSGGQNPSVSLSGIVGIANGGTGILDLPGGGQILVGNANRGYNVRSLGGDVTVDSNGVARVISLYSYAVSNGAPVNGQYLGWNGAQWGTTPAVASLVAGAGMAVSGATGNVTVSIPSGVVTNAMLVNPSITINGANGLSSCGATALGATCSISPTYGSAANQFAQGNDARFPPASTAAGKLVVDSGTGYVEGPACALNTLPHGAGAGTYTCSSVANADLVNPSITINGSNGISSCGSTALGATCTVSQTFGTDGTHACAGNDARLPPTSTAAGKLLYDNGSGYSEGPACATNQLPHGAGAAAYTCSSIATGDIAGSAVTYAKIQNEAASSLLGNPTGSSAAPSEVTLGAGLSFSASSILIAAGAITNAMLAGSIDLTVKVTGLLPVANGGTATATPGITFGAVPSFLGGEIHFRRPVADLAATIATTDFIVEYTSITATRVATLPNANVGSGTQFYVGDVSGSVSTTIKINVQSAGGTIDGVAAGTGVNIVVPRCFAGYESDGTKWRTIAGLICYSGVTLAAPTIADFTNAGHNHQNAAGGGQLNATSVFSAGTVPAARLTGSTAQAGSFFAGTTVAVADGVVIGVYKSHNAGTIGYITGVITTAGVGGTTGIVMQVIDQDNANAEVCNCNLGACTQVQGTSVSCNCNAAFTAAHKLAVQFKSVSDDCATNPTGYFNIEVEQ